MIDPFVRVEVEPSLSAGFKRTRVPGDGQCLEASARQLEKVLLQWIDSERVSNLEVGELPVRSVGAHDELVVPPEELRSDPRVIEARSTEVAQYRGVGRNLHGLRMLRAQPCAVLIGVASGTGVGAHVCRSFGRAGRRGRGRRPLHGSVPGPHCIERRRRHGRGQNEYDYESARVRSVRTTRYRRSAVRRRPTRACPCTGFARRRHRCRSGCNRYRCRPSSAVARGRRCACR